MKYTTLMTAATLAIGSAFCNGTPLEYNNKVSVGISSVSYEFSSKDSLLIGGEFSFVPRNDVYGFTAYAGKNFDLQNGRSVTPYVGGSFLDLDGKQHGWPVMGVRFNEDFLSWLSVGGDLITTVSFEKETATALTFNGPITFHLGESRAYDISFIPSMGLMFFDHKTTQVAGMNFKVGYRF